eukprot:15455334-Alexandrium_andersonii.AAC.1
MSGLGEAERGFIYRRNWREMLFHVILPGWVGAGLFRPNKPRDWWRWPECERRRFLMSLCAGQYVDCFVQDDSRWRRG